MAELSEKQLEEMVVGKASKASATFYEHAKLDIGESRRQNRRVYKNTAYIKLTSPGVRDFISREVRPEDIRNYPGEWQHFQSTRQGARRSAKVDIIPGLKLEHLQELLDLGLTTIELLAGVDMVPPHLEYARRSAVALHAVLEEQYNASKEESGEESRSAEGVAEESASSDRREHGDLVGQPVIPGSEDRRGDPAEGHEAHRRAHRDQGRLIDNWSVEFRM